MSSELSELVNDQHVYKADVEVDLCDSCGYEYPTDELERYIVGELRNKKYQRRRGVVVYRMENHTVKQGSICKHCRDMGPVSIPDTVQKSIADFDLFNRTPSYSLIVAVLILVLTLMAMYILFV